MTTRKHGFITLEITLGIILLLILLLGTAYRESEAFQTARTTQATTTAASLATFISEYNVEVGSYPNSLTDLTQKVGDYGPWIKSVPKDPWEKSYFYQHTNDGFVIYSGGKDGFSHGSTVTAINKGDIGFIGK